MITEEEAFWAGIAVAVMMLGGGFSMLFLQAFTGFGAVVLALGLMTMALTIQMRAKPIEHVETWTPIESRILTPTPPIESPSETVETQPSPEPSQVEAKTEQPSSAAPAEPAEPSERVEPTEPTEQVEPTQTIEQPSQPQAPAEEETETPKSEEKPEEPQVVAETN